jgi:hypothetical protein
MKSLSVIAWISTVALTCTLGCSGSTPASPSPGTGVSMHAEVTDPAGDVRQSPTGRPVPDLVRGTADVEGSNITFGARFAPGTFDPSGTWVLVNMDVDANRSTGVRIDLSMGIDYFLFADLEFSQTVASVHRCTSSSSTDCPRSVGTAPISVVADGVDITIPLSMLGNDDGRMLFRFYTQLLVDSDDMPDMFLSPGQLR